MRRITLPLAFILVCGCLVSARPPAIQPRTITNPAAYEDGIAFYFSPDGGAAAAVVEQIEQATASIDIQAYSFTHAGIARALLDAHKRGVKVRALLDKSNRTAKYSSATFLHNAGVPVWIDDARAIAHNKVILIDGQVIITGSMNVTRAGDEKNAENTLTIQGKDTLMEAYQENFERHMEHAKKYER